MADAKVVIKAQNDIKAGLDNAKTDLLGFGDAAKSVGQKLEQALTVTAIAAGLKKLGEEAFECFKEFGEGERRINQLKIALDGNQASLDRATRLIDSMRKVSLSSKDDIESLVTELASLGKSDTQIEEITKASVALANVTHKDLNTAFTQVNATYSGTIGKTGPLIQGMSDLTKEQLAAGEGARLIIERLGGLSNQLAENDIPQKLKNMKDGFEELKENIGKNIAPAFNPILEAINSIVEGWNRSMRAADSYNKLQTSIGYSTKINAAKALKGDKNDDLTEVKAQMAVFEKKYLSDAKGNKSEQNRLLQGNSTYQGLRVQSETLTREIATLEGTITDLNKAWTNTPTSLLNKEDIVDPVKLIRDTASSPSSSDSTDDATKVVKDNYKTVTDILASIKQFTARDKLHPYTNDQSASFWDSIKEKVFDADALTLGPEGKKVLDEIWGLLSKALTPGAVGEIVTSANVVEPNQPELASNDSWSRHYQALGEAADANAKSSELDAEVKKYLAKDNLDWFIQYRPKETPIEYKATYGQSGVTPSQLGAGGASITDQIASLNSSKPSFFQNLSGDFKGVFTDIKSSATSIFSVDAFKKQGLDGGEILKTLNSSFGQLMSSMGPVVQIFASTNPVMAALLPIIQGAVDILGPAITEVIDPLMNTLTMIGETLGVALLPILDAISPIFAILASILQAVLLPVIQLLSPIITVVASVFELLTPILKLFAQAIVIVMAPIQFIGDLFTWVATAIKNAVHNLVEFIEHPFNANNRDIWQTKGFSSDAFTGLQQRLDQIANIGQTNLAGTTTTSSSTSVGSASASYSGSNQITINIYQQAPVVGDGGMTEFASMVRDKFVELDYYNA